MDDKLRTCGYWLAMAVLAAWPMAGGRALADTFQVTKTLEDQGRETHVACQPTAYGMRRD